MYLPRELADEIAVVKILLEGAFQSIAIERRFALDHSHDLIPEGLYILLGHQITVEGFRRLQVTFDQDDSIALKSMLSHQLQGDNAAHAVTDNEVQGLRVLIGFVNPGRDI